MTVKTIRGCVRSDSILRCPPGTACDWPKCAGQIQPLAEGEVWGRDENGWRGTPNRRPR